MHVFDISMAALKVLILVLSKPYGIETFVIFNLLVMNGRKIKQI